MIRCKNDSIYTGMTGNYIKRWEQHQHGSGARYIKANEFKGPVFLCEFNTRREAIKFERHIKKQGKQYKENLINSCFNIIQSINIDHNYQQKH